MTQQLNCAEEKATTNIISSKTKFKTTKNPSEITDKSKKSEPKILKKQTVTPTKSNVQKKKKKKQDKVSDAPPSEEAPLSDYVKFCAAKRKRNETMLDTLGLNSATLKKKSPKKSCTHTHSDIVSYKEEGDRRYFKKDMLLYKSKCAKCKKEFSNVDGNNRIVPRKNSPAYVCIGRIKYNCTHSLCYSCYHDMAVTCTEAPRKRRSTRNIKAT